ncbi:MAG TPA: type II toxin-antitoxin system HicA family toxin [Candidatus Binataceae bacterium]|nr:type II toxin-antitoxin system HicA family toxin [Candidatus Binataceae bacterium]
MSSLPVCSGADAIRAFERDGWIKARQHGSHVTLSKPGNPAILTVPLHRELDRGLLRGLIRKAGISVEEFSRLLSNV